VRAEHVLPTDETPQPGAAAGGDAALELDGVVLSALTESGRVPIVEDVSFAIQPGQTLGLVGESGSGKTMTALAAMGLLPGPSVRREAGTVRLQGRDLTRLGQRELATIRGQEISMVFQEPMTSLDPAFRIGDLIGEVLRRHLGMARGERRRRAIELLDRVGIPDASRRVEEYPHAFSGGMRQRVMIAMAIACEPAVLIADEPTTALDVTVQEQILDLLRSLQEDMGMAMLLVTHDLGVVAEHCHDVAVMYAGQIVEQAGAAELFGRPRHPYTEGLISSVPSGGQRRRRFKTIEGRVPPPGHLPQGCRFADRCSYAAEACFHPVPLERVDVSRRVRCVRWTELDLEGVPQ
jgi:oligopeptide/dipeptide ABC transporter ATP-binding protein